MGFSGKLNINKICRTMSFKKIRVIIIIIIIIIITVLILSKL